MKAVRVHQFGGIDAIEYDEIARPVPGPGQVLIRVMAAGVGPWDAWVREGRSALPQSLPLTLGSDIAGFVEEAAADVARFRPGDRVFGVTNPRFTGGCAEFAVAEAGMIAPLPQGLSFVEAASVPVVASTAWQMLFDHGGVQNGTRVLILGAAGSVGAYAVQLARIAGARILAAGRSHDVDYLRSLRADRVIDIDKDALAETAKQVDVVIDLAGAEAQAAALPVLKPGGILVSAVARPDEQALAAREATGVFFIVSVSTEGLERIARRFDSGELIAKVGEVLPLAEARQAHAMLAGKPHKRGKIVLTP
jgi:NADPH:quinone reductase-like Zn-dependent oxidoreductase